jgi:hypothetical protein
MLGAKLFAELGYAEELAEVEKWTGVRFDPEPDGEMLKRLSGQLAEATGCRWEPNYRMRTDLFFEEPPDADDRMLPPSSVVEPVEAGPRPGLDVRRHDPVGAQPHPELMQLRMTVRALEQRLEDGVREQKRLRSQIHAMKRKADWLKSAIPFGDRLSRLASAYMSGSGGKK